MLQTHSSTLYAVFSLKCAGNTPVIRLPPLSSRLGTVGRMMAAVCPWTVKIYSHVTNTLKYSLCSIFVEVCTALHCTALHCTGINKKNSNWLEQRFVGLSGLVLLYKQDFLAVLVVLYGLILFLVGRQIWKSIITIIGKLILKIILNFVWHCTIQGTHLSQGCHHSPAGWV